MMALNKDYVDAGSEDRASSDRDLLDSLTDPAILSLGADGCVTRWNAGATDLLGYAADDARGMPVTAFVASLSGLPMPRYSQLRDMARGGAAMHDNGCCIHKDGSRFRAAIRFYPIPPDGCAAVIRRRESRARRIEGERRLQQLIDGITDYAIFMIDADGIVSSWNAGAERIKGYRAQEIVGEHFSRFYTEEDRAAGEPARLLAQALAQGRCEKEGWRVRKDGSRFLASVVIDPIKDDNGDIVGFAKITRDITERGKLQAEIDRNRVAMAHSQRMEAIGQLTGGVAHDFNNLLTIIMSNLDVMARAPGDVERNRHLIEDAQRAAEHGSVLTSQLLAFARSQPLCSELQNINALVGGFASVLRGAAGNAVTLRLSLADSMDRIVMDATQFKAALLNLVVNASESMPDGGEVVLSTSVVEVRREDVSVTPRVPAGTYVGITVSDNGCGMAPGTLEHVFEPFYTSKEVGEGSGLGLSQVYGFATQSGGGVGIATTLGEGTDVTIYLPLGAHTESEELARAEIPLGTILLVEDDENVRRATLEAVTLLGYRVVSEANGPDALARLRRDEDIDVLFTDVVMPRGMSGVTLACEARRLRPDLRVLLASGHPRDAFASAGDIDEFAFLAKPYRLQELADRLQLLKRPGEGGRREILGRCGN